MAVIVHAGADPLSTTAIDRAVAEARVRDLPLVLVAQVAMPRGETDAASYQARRAEVAAQLEAQATQLRVQGIACTTVMPNEPSNPADAVLTAAREHDAQLVVIGARRRTRVGKAVFGSWAQEIILGADCPVLVVKVPADQEDAL